MEAKTSLAATEESPVGYEAITFRGST